MALLEMIKWRNAPKITFRGKEMAYDVENTERHAKIVIGMEGKLRNPWNEPVLLRITLNKTTDKLVIYIAKDGNGIADAKAIYSSNPEDGVYSDAFPVTDEELDMLRALLTRLIEENRKENA